jgi:hypothetical protein
MAEANVRAHQELRGGTSIDARADSPIQRCMALWDPSRQDSEPRFFPGNYCHNMG